MPDQRQGRGSMLSRTADNLYWLARYVERAEYLARILEVTQRLTTLPLAYVGTSNEWESAVATAGCAHAFAAAYPEANEEAVTDFLCFSTANPSSIRSCFEIARTNARAVRTALTMEMWDAINGTWLELKRYGNGLSSREELMRFLRWVQECSLRFDGLASISSAPTTPRASSTSSSICCCRPTSGSADRSITSSGRRSCARFRRSR